MDNLINEVRAEFLKAGYPIELNDPLLHTIVAVLMMTDGSVRHIQDEREEFKRLNAELKKATTDLKLEVEKVKGSRCMGGKQQSEYHPYQFGTLFFGMILGALALGSTLYMIYK